MARAEAVLNRALPLTAEAKELLITMADGDGRMLLNLIEQTGMVGFSAVSAEVGKAAGAARCMLNRAMAII